MKVLKILIKISVLLLKKGFNVMRWIGLLLAFDGLFILSGFANGQTVWLADMEIEQIT